MREAAAARPEAERVELRFADAGTHASRRVGQKGRTTHVWYERGRRPRGARRPRFGSAYLFGAVCPERDTGVASVLPEASTRAMNPLLAEVRSALPPRTHAVVVPDGAGWHAADGLEVPPDLTLVPVPPYSPELVEQQRCSTVEKVWQFLRERAFSHRAFPTVDAVVEACCRAWNRLLAEPGRLRSLTASPWLPSAVSTS